MLVPDYNMSQVMSTSKMNTHYLAHMLLFGHDSLNPAGCQCTPSSPRCLLDSSDESTTMQAYRQANPGMVAEDKNNKSLR
jgi:hypothetical protein